MLLMIILDTQKRYHLFITIILAAPKMEIPIPYAKLPLRTYLVPTHLLLLYKEDLQTHLHDHHPKFPIPKLSSPTYHIKHRHMKSRL